MSFRIPRNRARAIAPVLGLAIVTAAALLGPIQSAGASTPKLYASPTGSGTFCSRSQKCTLTEALSIAPSGTTILLDPGAYNEQPTVSTSDITVEGPGTGSPAILKKTAAVANAATPSGHPETALVYVPAGGTGFTLQNATIDGSSANLPGSADFAAIYARDSSATFKNVTTTSITPSGGITGVQIGDNVLALADPSDTTNVTLTSDTIGGYNKNGVTCDGVGVTCTVSKTTVTGAGPTPITAQNGVQISDGAGGSVVSSTVSGNAYTGGTPQAAGILIYDAASGVSVSKSTMSGNDSQLYVINDGSEPGATSDNVSVTGNTSTNSAAYDGMSFDSVSHATISSNKISNTGHLGGFGIGLYGVTSSTLLKNKISSTNSDGIYVGGYAGDVTVNSTLNAITSNKVTGSGGDGLHADTTSANNTFTSNTSKGNTGFDAHDQGTGNTWTSTHCTTHAASSPLGIC
jgi:hypothetical protein